jgi:hypothetical protein
METLSDLELLASAVQEALDAHAAGVVLGPALDEVVLERAVCRARRRDATATRRPVTAAECYEFPGSSSENKPPYWVARHGLTVTSQIEGDEVEVVECGSVEEARAEFAERTVDPDGPGAPQSGDLIRVVWGKGAAVAGEKFTVNSVIHRDRDGWDYFYVSVDARTGPPLELRFGQYVILARPAIESSEVAGLAVRTVVAGDAA